MKKLHLLACILPLSALAPIASSLVAAGQADARELQPANSPPLRVTRSKDGVEIDNGLVKARFTAGKEGVQQEYLAARGGDWLLLAEDVRPRRGGNAPVVEVFADQPRGSVASLYDTSLDPAHRFLVSATFNLTVLADTDTDGLPDIGETNCGLNPASANHVAADDDSDGLTNGQEYTAGTDPTNARVERCTLKVSTFNVQGFIAMVTKPR